MNVMYSEALCHEVNKLHKEECSCCIVNHPIQCREGCLMMSRGRIRMG